MTSMVGVDEAIGAESPSLLESKMKFDVEFENMETREKWTIEVDAADEEMAEAMAEAMCENTPIMFEVRPFS
jgi:hypothetical protein